MLKKLFLITFIALAISESNAQNVKADLRGDSCGYTVIEVKANTKFTNVAVSIKDKDGQALQGYVGLRSKGDEPILNCLTDKNGQVKLSIYDPRYATFLTVDFIGYDRIKIPLSTLKNKESIINVILKGQQTEN
jgi:hypothetical protein